VKWKLEKTEKLVDEKLGSVMTRMMDPKEMRRRLLRHSLPPLVDGALQDK
jgi:hypothetical protein